MLIFVLLCIASCIMSNLVTYWIAYAFGEKGLILVCSTIMSTFIVILSIIMGWI